MFYGKDCANAVGESLGDCMVEVSDEEVATFIPPSIMVDTTPAAVAAKKQQEPSSLESLQMILHLQLLRLVHCLLDFGACAIKSCCLQKNAAFFEATAKAVGLRKPCSIEEFTILLTDYQKAITNAKKGKRFPLFGAREYNDFVEEFFKISTAKVCNFATTLQLAPRLLSATRFIINSGFAHISKLSVAVMSSYKEKDKLNEVLLDNMVDYNSAIAFLESSFVPSDAQFLATAAIKALKEWKTKKDSRRKRRRNPMTKNPFRSLEEDNYARKLSGLYNCSLRDSHPAKRKSPDEAICNKVGLNLGRKKKLQLVGEKEGRTAREGSMDNEGSDEGTVLFFDELFGVIDKVSSSKKSLSLSSGTKSVGSGIERCASFNSTSGENSRSSSSSSSSMSTCSNDTDGGTNVCFTNGCTNVVTTDGGRRGARYRRCFLANLGFIPLDIPSSEGAWSDLRKAGEQIEKELS